MGPLVLDVVHDTLRHFLDGKPVAADDELELLLTDGRWLRGRYDWSGSKARWPGLRVELGGPWETNRDGELRRAVLALHPDAILRWVVK